MRPLLIGSMIFSMTILPVPSAFAADDAKTEKLKLQNVELSASGKVHGRLIDEKGQPLGNQVVQILTKDGQQNQTTAGDGSFTVAAANGGNCAIVVGKKNFACRLWQHNTAPPKSLTSFGIVYSDGPIVRGQEGCDDGNGGRFGRLGGVSGGQLLGLGLLAGAVVAIVLAVDDDDDGS